MKKITSIDFIKYILLLILCCYGLSVKAADIYKWVDEKGRVHYSAEPPKDQSTSNGTNKNTRKVETLDSEELKNRNIVPNIVGNRNVLQPMENTDTKQQFQDRSVGEIKSISPSVDSSDIALQEMNCEINRRNVEKMQSSDPVFVRDKQGNKVTLDTQQREAALDKAKKNVTQFCKPAASSTTLASSSTKENQRKKQEAENQQIVAEQKRLTQEKEQAERQKPPSTISIANSQADTTNHKTVALSSETIPIVQNSTKDDGNWYSGLIGIGKKTFKVVILIVCLILPPILLTWLSLKGEIERNRS